MLRSKWEKSQDGLLLFTPERVKLTVNSKKETNVNPNKTKDKGVIKESFDYHGNQVTIAIG